MIKNTKIKLIILSIITLIILFFVLKDDFNTIIQTLFNSNIKYIFLLVLSVIIGDICKSISVTFLTKKVSSNYKYSNGFTLTTKTNFFNGITPFSLGGQPFQLYSLKKTNNINYLDGADILFEDFYTYQLALMFLTVLFLILNNIFKIVYINSIAGKLMFIGFIVNIFVMLFLILLPIFKSKKHKLIILITNLLEKMHIIKDKKKLFDKIIDKLDIFRSQINNTLKDPNLIIKCCLLNIIKLLSVGVGIYFSLMAVNTKIDFNICLITIIFITTMASFIPIPGASGGVEYSFVLLLSSYVLTDYLLSSLILWRFATYYLPIIIGGILFMIEDGKNI